MLAMLERFESGRRLTDWVRRTFPEPPPMIDIESLSITPQGQTFDFTGDAVRYRDRLFALGYRPHESHWGEKIWIRPQLMAEDSLLEGFFFMKKFTMIDVAKKLEEFDRQIQAGELNDAPIYCKPPVRLNLKNS